jgi:ParB family chromosome partitioning protein
MGRGLGALLPDSGTADAELRELPVEVIEPNPDQPRARIEPEALDGLVESISSSGMVQPLIVRPLPGGTYELVAGERRWRAAQKAGLKRVPAVIRAEDESRRLETALIENMVREDLSPVEEAKACAALVEDLGLSKEDLAKRVGRSRAAVSNLIRLLTLPDEALDLVDRGKLSEGHGRALLLAKGNDARRRLARAAAKGEWSVRETERKAKAAKSNGRRPAKGGRLSAEQREAVQRAEDALEDALGRDVRVRVARDGALRAELRFDDLDELLRLARKLG